MENQFSQKGLISGIEYAFEDNTKENALEFWYRVGGPNWANKFQIMFNGEFDSFKSYETLKKRVNHLIEEYELKKVENETIE